MPFGFAGGMCFLWWIWTFTKSPFTKHHDEPVPGLKVLSNGELSLGWIKARDTALPSVLCHDGGVLARRILSSGQRCVQAEVVVSIQDGEKEVVMVRSGRFGMNGRRDRFWGWDKVEVWNIGPQVWV
ncbi:hypothetical protein B0H13DRAFT_2277724 [Mycena leptocephala]|nr:hypothetical protein B0H13DRAFT_2277724 [Mycena leptocephala]